MAVTPADVVALRSVGMSPGTPLWSSVVMLLPPVVDRVGIAAGAAPQRRTRVDTVVRSRRRLLDDLRGQADRIGAAGLVGVVFTQRPLGLHAPTGRVGDVVELTATAVPVTVATRSQPAHCFRTAIDPAGVAVLLRSGWLPVDVLVAGTTQSRSARHRSEDALASTSRLNREVPGPTVLVQRGRRLVRQQFFKAAPALGGDGVLLHGGFEVTWTSTYHLVQVAATANVIARFGRSSSDSQRAAVIAVSVAG